MKNALDKRKIFKHVRYSYGPHRDLNEFFLWAKERTVTLLWGDLRRLFGASRLSVDTSESIETELLKHGYTHDLDALPTRQNVPVMIAPIDPPSKRRARAKRTSRDLSSSPAKPMSERSSGPLQEAPWSSVNQPGNELRCDQSEQAVTEPQCDSGDRQDAESREDLAVEMASIKPSMQESDREEQELISLKLASAFLTSLVLWTFSLPVQLKGIRAPQQRSRSPRRSVCRAWHARLWHRPSPVACPKSKRHRAR